MKQKESIAAKTFAPAAAQQQGQSALLTEGKQQNPLVSFNVRQRIPHSA
jgi:hypothetical protein